MNLTFVVMLMCLGIRLPFDHYLVMVHGFLRYIMYKTPYHMSHKIVIPIKDVNVEQYYE